MKVTIRKGRAAILPNGLQSNDSVAGSGLTNISSRKKLKFSTRGGKVWMNKAAKDAVQEKTIKRLGYGVKKLSKEEILHGLEIQSKKRFV